MKYYQHFVQKPWFAAAYLGLVIAILIGHFKILQTIYAAQTFAPHAVIPATGLILGIVNSILVTDPPTKQHFGKLAPFIANHQTLFLSTFLIINVFNVILVGIAMCDPQLLMINFKF